MHLQVGFESWDVISDRTGAPRSDPLRLAAVLLYARENGAGAYAEERRREAVSCADAEAAKYWSLVEAALLTLIPVESSFGSLPH